MASAESGGTDDAGARIGACESYRIDTMAAVFGVRRILRQTSLRRRRRSTAACAARLRHAHEEGGGLARLSPLAGVHVVPVLVATTNSVHHAMWHAHATCDPAEWRTAP